MSVQQQQQLQQINVAKAEEAIANNKKKKEFEVCTCASTELTSANSGSVNCHNCKQRQQQQQQQQGGDINSKLYNNNKLHFEEEEAADSGFLSAPHLSSQFDKEEEEEEEEEEKPQEKSAKFADNKDQEETFLDSGCIEAEVDFEYDVDKKFSKKTVVAQATGSTTVDDMRLKHNVDSGITERFCSLSLQTDGLPINNLNSTTQQQQLRRSSNTSSTSALLHKQQQQQQMRLTDWEQFYQQNSDGDTPLHLACLAGAEEVVMALLRIAVHPCLYNIQNDDAQTPLHMAALSAQPKLIRWLLTMGAEPSIRDAQGNTALHLAVISGEEQCVRAFLTPLNPVEVQDAQRVFAQKIKDRKLFYNLHTPRLDLEICNYNGERCVHLAAQEGRINILRMLVSCGADINSREGKSGRTPLHIAILSCNETLVNFLLEECHNKLNLETETYAGLTAYQISCLLNKEQLSNILEKRGAEPLTPPASDYENSDGEDIEDTKIFGDPSYFVSYNGANITRVA